MNPFIPFIFPVLLMDLMYKEKNLNQKIIQSVPVRNRGLSRDLLFEERKPGISSIAYSHDDAQIIQ